MGNAESYNIFKTNGNYNSFLIQTHKHEVAIDILNKYESVLVINLVRLPIDRVYLLFMKY